MKTNVSGRFKELIERGDEIYKQSYTGAEMVVTYGRKHLSDETFTKCISWILSGRNLLLQVFGSSSDHFVLFSKIFDRDSEEDDFSRLQFCKENISAALGVLKSAEEEFNLGFTHEITHILSVEFFDSVLDQSKELLNKGFKDPAAILGRVVIENTLKDLCERNNIHYADGEGASKYNEKLKDAAVFTLPQFKLCRTYIETGNDAAHGDFDKYTQEDVKKMLDYIENTLLVLH